MFADIRVRCGGMLESLQAKVRYVLEEFGARTGHRYFLIPGGDGDAVYSPEPPASGIWLKFDEQLYGDGAPVGWLDRVVAATGGATYPEAVGQIDIIGSAYRLVTLADELAMPSAVRTIHGNLPLAAQAQVRRSTARIALFDRLAYLFARQFGAPSSPPAWPGGHNIAVCVTHDTDAVNWGHPLELAFNAAKRVLRNSRLHGELIRSGWRDGFRADASRYFEAGRQFLNPTGAPSTYYLSVLRRSRRTMNDVRSRVDNNATDWQRLRALAAEGHEFGYHPQIRAKDDLDEMVASKYWIEERLQHPLFGVRHHYWAIDWNAPWLTYRKHVNAGFRYDASMAFPDAPGFRAATCHPFRPFDPVRQRPLDMYVVPTALMDGHLLGLPATEEQARLMLRHVDEMVAECVRISGVLVLDWHTETSSDRAIYKGYFSRLIQILQRIGETADPWYATPWDIVRHVHERRTAAARGGT